MKNQSHIRPDMKREARRRRRGGMTIIYVLVLLTVIFALASFAVDYGRVQLSRSQFQTCADVAAKWAAMAVNSPKNVVVARANEAAADNKVNGVAVTFAANDVLQGSWNEKTRVFTANLKPYNAVKVSGTSTIPLMLGNMVNKPSVTMRVTAVARTSSIGGVIGLTAITFHNRAFIGSYDSTVTTTPTEATAGSNAKVYSNGSITGHKAGVIQGDVTYGPSGALNAAIWNVSGQTEKLPSNVVVPAVPAWNPAPNPGSITNGDYVHNGGTLNGGTYWFSKLTLNASLTFNGPATVYVNGDIIMDGTDTALTGYDAKPGNLKIYQIGTGRKFETKNKAVIKAVIIAPGSQFEAKNNLDYYGLAIFESIEMKNDANFYFDESTAVEQAVALVQ